MRAPWRAALALVLLCAVAGCADFDALEADARCRVRGCDGGPSLDAGGTPADGGALEDAGVDGGGPDAGAPDAGTPDAGGLEDAGVDAGQPDAGALDSGVPDGGRDAGALDAGPSDAGLPRDAGVRSLTVAWARGAGIEQAGAIIQPGVVAASPGGRVLLAGNVVLTDPNPDNFGGYAGSVYVFDGDSGAVVASDGGLVASGPFVDPGVAARTYVAGRITASAMVDDDFFISMAGEWVDGGRRLSPSTGAIIGFGDIARRYRIDSYPVPDPQTPVWSWAGTNASPGVTGRVSLPDGGARWTAWVRPRSGSNTLSLSYTATLGAGFSGNGYTYPCGVPRQGVSLGTQFIGFTTCTGSMPGAYVLVYSMLSSGVATTSQVRLQEPVPPTASFAQAPRRTVNLPPLLAWAAPVDGGVDAVRVAEVTSGGLAMSSVVATSPGPLKQVSLALDEQRQAYVLIRTQTFMHSLRAVGSDVDVFSQSEWFVLALDADAGFRWIAPLDVADTFDSSGLSTAAGRLFMEARCTGLGTPGRGFCQPGLGNVVLRLVPTDGLPL